MHHISLQFMCSWSDPAERSSQKEGKDMQYLVQMNLVTSGRPTTAEEGLTLIKQVIFPSLELCRKMQDEKKILAGGPVRGNIGHAIIVEADSAMELDELLEALPMWPQTETSVIPLTTLEYRIKVIRPMYDHLVASVHEQRHFPK